MGHAWGSADDRLANVAGSYVFGRCYKLSRARFAVRSVGERSRCVIVELDQLTT
jgi:hypothetical protein